MNKDVPEMSQVKTIQKFHPSLKISSIFSCKSIPEQSVRKSPHDHVALARLPQQSSTSPVSRDSD